MVTGYSADDTAQDYHELRIVKQGVDLTIDERLLQKYRLLKPYWDENTILTLEWNNILSSFEKQYKKVIAKFPERKEVLERLETALRKPQIGKKDKWSAVYDQFIAHPRNNRSPYFELNANEQFSLHLAKSSIAIEKTRINRFKQAVAILEMYSDIHNSDEFPLHIHIIFDAILNSAPFEPKYYEFHANLAHYFRSVINYSKIRGFTLRRVLSEPSVYAFFEKLAFSQKAILPFDVNLAILSSWKDFLLKPVLFESENFRAFRFSSFFKDDTAGLVLLRLRQMRLSYQDVVSDEEIEILKKEKLFSTDWVAWGAQQVLENL